MSSQGENERIVQRLYFSKILARNVRLLILALLILFTALARAQTPGPAFRAKPYWTAVAAGAATAYVDAWSTEKLFRIRPQAYEASSPWLYGRRPGPARMYATITAETAAVAALTYLLKRKHKRYWFAPEAYSIGTHALGAANNVRFVQKDHGF